MSGVPDPILKVQKEVGAYHFRFYRPEYMSFDTQPLAMWVDGVSPYVEGVNYTYHPAEHFIIAVADWVPQSIIAREVYYKLPDEWRTEKVKDLLQSWQSKITIVSKDAGSDPADLARLLPGVFSTVRHPVTGSELSLSRCIISLNDKYKWDRNKIADWIETLDIDITFKVE